MKAFNSIYISNLNKILSCYNPPDPIQKCSLEKFDRFFMSISLVLGYFNIKVTKRNCLLLLKLFKY